MAIANALTPVYDRFFLGIRPRLPIDNSPMLTISSAATSGSSMLTMLAAVSRQEAPGFKPHLRFGGK